MRNARLIARLDVKGPNLIKGIHLEGLRVIGDPQQFACQYYEQGADELIYIDIVASLYGRNNLSDIVSKTAQNVFVPMTVGGGIRSIEDVRSMLRAGADKIAINTAAVHNPPLISDVARTFGSQCMVLSVEAKRRDSGGWEAFTDNGREATGVDVVSWCQQAYELGAGEILLTSVDQEGTRKGFDTALIEAVSAVVPIPVIASGVMGNVDHMLTAFSKGADAVAIADLLHYRRSDMPVLRAAAANAGFPVRKDAILAA